MSECECVGECGWVCVRMWVCICLLDDTFPLSGESKSSRKVMGEIVTGGKWKVERELVPWLKR